MTHTTALREAIENAERLGCNQLVLSMARAKALFSSLSAEPSEIERLKTANRNLAAKCEQYCRTIEAYKERITAEPSEEEITEAYKRAHAAYHRTHTSEMAQLRAVTRAILSRNTGIADGSFPHSNHAPAVGDKAGTSSPGNAGTDPAPDTGAIDKFLCESFAQSAAGKSRAGLSSETLLWLATELGVESRDPNCVDQVLISWLMIALRRIAARADGGK